jgi:hypothetical protein
MLRVITSVQEFEQVRPSWDDFVAKMGTNWHLFSDFIQFRMLRCKSLGEIPFVILKVINGNVVGIAAFWMRRRNGIGQARFLLTADCSPDFLVIPEHRQSFVDQTLEVLLRRMRCQIVTLSLPRGSPQAVALDYYCKRKGLRLARTETDKHSILLVDGEWKDFERLRGRNFRNHFKKVESKLTRSGAWRTEQAKANSAASINKIVSVETHSWKHQGERRKTPILDHRLRAYTTYQDTPSLARFTPDVWFLELEGTPIAFVIAVEVNGVACLAKTSYDDRYRNLYAGEYVQNTVIRSLFDSKRISRVDFMMCLPYHRRWTSSCEPRETFRISRGGLVFPFFESLRRRLLFGGLLGVRLPSNFYD